MMGMKMNAAANEHFYLCEDNKQGHTLFTVYILPWFFFGICFGWSFSCAETIFFSSSVFTTNSEEILNGASFFLKVYHEQICLDDKCYL